MACPASHMVQFANHHAAGRVGHLRQMCPYQKCGQAFGTAAERASHMGEHTDERYYFCWNVQCNKRFNSREAMEAHMQKVHRNEIGAE